uniref:Uncharacterized protein n=1 Tax=Octopus bimaculoides TaxID=37653 RepID=A0A0L8FN78_OCTBM
MQFVNLSLFVVKYGKKSHVLKWDFRWELRKKKKNFFDEGTILKRQILLLSILSKLMTFVATIVWFSPHCLHVLCFHFRRYISIGIYANRPRTPYFSDFEL